MEYRHRYESTGEPAAILIVEDDAAVAEQLTLTTEHLGYRVSGVAETGPEALALIARETPRAILMDILLPGPMDGIETANRISARWDIPLIYITNYADPDLLARARITEPFGYILKPLRPRELEANLAITLYQHDIKRQMKDFAATAQTLMGICHGVIVLDPKRRFSLLNPKAEELIQRPAGEIQGSEYHKLCRLRDAVGWDPVEKLYEYGDRNVRVPISGTGDLTVLAVNKSIPVQYSGSCVYNLQGRFLGVALIFYDISPAKRAEAKARHHERLSSLLINSTLQGFIATDAAGVIEEVNPAFAGLLGYEPRELEGQPISMIESDIDYPVDGERDARFSDVIFSSKARNFETRLRRRDGSELPVMVSAQFLFNNGESICYALLSDMTFQRRQEALLTELAETVSTATGYDYFDRLTEFLAKNLDIACAFIGRADTSDFRVIQIISIYPDGELKNSIRYDMTNTPFQSVMDGKFCWYPGDVAKQFPNDSLLKKMRAQGYAGIPLAGDDGHITGLLAIVDTKPLEDSQLIRNLLQICARQAAAELDRIVAEEDLKKLQNHLERRVKQRTAEIEAVNKELESFSYSVSHDLRAPLRSINGFSQVLVEDFSEYLGESGCAYLQRIRAGTQRMGRLIDDLLDLAKVSKFPLNRQAMDLSAVVERVADKLREAFPSPETNLKISPEIQVFGDPILLELVMSNLLDNAWKFTRKTHKPEIEFGVNYNGDERVFFISDNGAGFDPAYMGKMFGAFQRLHGDTDFPGTGIGLATVQRIVNRHGGRIWSDGRPNEGATFYFTLPPEDGETITC